MLNAMGKCLGWLIAIVAFALAAIYLWLVFGAHSGAATVPFVPGGYGTLARFFNSESWVWFLFLGPFAAAIAFCPLVFTRLPARSFAGRTGVALVSSSSALICGLIIGLFCAPLAPMNQYKEAVRYQQGTGVARDYDRAAQLYTRAAEAGVVEAQNNLAMMYLEGQGVPKDPRRAVELLRQAADGGCGMAIYNLAQRYQFGDGVEQNDVRAAELYQKALQVGIIDMFQTRLDLRAVANYNLGLIYERDNGVKPDDVRAFNYYSAAATHGYAPAELNVGTMYAQGRGVKRNYELAIINLQMAANDGNAAADHNLAVMYANGWGVPRDPARARALDDEARARGYRPGQA